MLGQEPRHLLPWKRCCALLLSVSLAACSSLSEAIDDMETPALPSLPKVSNWFKKEEPKLPGERVAVMTTQSANSVDSDVAKVPVTIPPAVANTIWSQPGGVASNAPGHLEWSGGIQKVWSVDAGKGSWSNGRLTARPIVYDGKVFVLDTKGQVRAFSVNTGSRVWGVSLTPENEKASEGFGGGLAADGGRLFVATGYGTVVAINPANGSKLWSKNLNVPIRSSPTASGDHVFVVTTEGRFYCLAGVDGQELWSYRGLPENATILNNASPAVAGNTVVVPFPAGEVIAFHVSDGKPYWSETLTRRKTGSSLQSLTDPARPAIDKGVVFAVGHAGRMVATAKETGERLWTRNIASIQTPWVAGDTVYVVDVEGSLMALTRQDGRVRWSTQLPGKGQWSGPVMAGGRLWLVSSSGLVVGADARTGQVSLKKDTGDQIYIAPVIAGGRMYLLTDKARLIALD